MHDLFYNIRKAINRFKRRCFRPAVEGFSEKMQFEPSFKKFIITVSIILPVAIIVILLFVFDVINFNNDKASVTDVSPSAETATIKPITSTEKSVTPSPTIAQIPTIEPTPTVTPIIIEDAPEPLPLLPSDTVIETGYTTIDFLNVRSGATTRHSILGVLPKYSIVEVITDEEWIKIKFLDGVGYISPKYYTPGPVPSPTPGPTPTPANYAGPVIRRHVKEDLSYLDGNTKIIIQEVKEDEIQFYAVEIWCSPGDIMTYVVDEKLDPTKRMDPSYMASEIDDVVFAINGDFAAYRDEGIIIRNGKIYREAEDREMLLLYDDGRMECIYDGDLTADEMIEAGVTQCWAYGPILVEDYTAFDDFTGRSNVNPPNPRTGIGMIDVGHYLIIVTDGRVNGYAGLTLVEFAKLFEDYGCKIAYNLEGGQASTLIFQGNIINKLSGGEKANSDIIYIK